jgi:ERCC4-related helicase
VKSPTNHFFVEWSRHVNDAVRICPTLVHHPKMDIINVVLPEKISNFVPKNIIIYFTTFVERKMEISQEMYTRSRKQKIPFL